MGRKLIIVGADFSENGFRTSNVVNIELKNDGTIPYKFYLLPTPLTYESNVNPRPVVPGDAILKSVSADGGVNIDSGTYVSFLFGRNQTDDHIIYIKSLTANYNKNIVNDANQSLMYINADVVDLRGIKFGDEINANKMFSGSSIADLKMPDVVINGANNMFYNYCNERTNVHQSFSFIKQIKGTANSIFKYLKCASADFSGIDVSQATDLQHAFQNNTLSEIDLSTWTFPHVRMSSMFENAANLKTLHLDKWDISADNGVLYIGLFRGCSALTTVYVTECSANAKTWLLTQLNAQEAGGSTNWTESTVDGKAALVGGS